MLLAPAGRHRPLAAATTDRLARRLHAWRDELDRQHERAYAELVDATVDADVSDLFDDRVAPSCSADRDSLWQVLRSLTQLRSGVVAALDRVAAGTYGSCTSCGGDIAVARLEAVPHASTCIRCA